MINNKPISFSIIAIFIGQSLINTACLSKTLETSSTSAPVEVSQSNTSNKTTTTPKNSSTPPSNKNLSTPELMCSPNKLRLGSILTLKMKSPHGGYLEIITPQQKYIFLSELDGDKLVEDALKAGATPFYAASEFTKLPELRINTSEATTTNYEQDEVNGKHQLSKIFSADGKYEILLSKDSFEQDDPVITGRCHVYFDKTKTSPKIVQPRKAANDEVINWKHETENLYFEAALSLKNGQPFAFSLEGYRIIRQKDFETANDCDFTVEKGKDDSVWQLSGAKTIISGKHRSGTPFQMFIEKTIGGFLIDTSAAAESCFNVGMPGNILLSKEGHKYNGKFVAPRLK